MWRISKEVIFPMSRGISLPKLLFVMLRTPRMKQFVRLEGRLPNSLLLDRSRNCMSGLQMEDERAPLRLFADKIIVIKLMPTNGGMEPLKKLDLDILLLMQEGEECPVNCWNEGQ
ncbi:hypothetical protein SUGI_0366530 [Cryptomeria japonica]|nr:hypothetical protein SUGI_0366530 [Cryptomeria japonica]